MHLFAMNGQTSNTNNIFRKTHTPDGALPGRWITSSAMWIRITSFAHHLPLHPHPPPNSYMLILFILWSNTKTPCCSYETANGIKGEEVGTLKKATNPDTSDVIIAQGSVSYTAPDGTLISLNYVADDVGGFQPRVSWKTSSSLASALYCQRLI